MTELAVTDYAGKATWSVITPTTGSLHLTALFGQSVSDTLDLSSPYYAASSDTATLTAGSSWISINNIPTRAVYGGSFKATFTGSYAGSPWVTSSTAAICTVEADKLTVDFVGVGTCTLNAHAPTGSSSSAANGGNQSFSIEKATLTVSADGKSAQYSDANPPLTFNYSSFKWTDTPSVIDRAPTCSTTRKVGDPAGVYNNAITCSGGADGNYDLTYVNGSFTVLQEDTYLEYSGDSLAQVNTALNLRITVWDSAASGYPTTAANPETRPKATIGDITRMWVQFNLYPEATCGTSTTIAPIYSRVSDAPTYGDGIGTANATYKSTSEGSYCVIARLVAGNTGGANQYYTAPDAQSAAVSFYQNSGKFATGGGWIKDPNGLSGSFSFISRYDSKGNPMGQLVYVYRGAFNGIPAVYIIRSTQLTALQITGTKYPLTATLQGKCTIQVIRTFGGAGLYSDFAATFKAVVVDTNKSSGANSDSFALTVWNKNGAAYKTVPAKLLSAGNVVIHLK